ncbi:cell envelope integrity protein TolA [Luteimonas sp. MC1572]|uniref:cell envelope integrity protein TolA n=1 Tax=Luteimonas sp. MC1572 TaxID=2799325 RepID=UPI0018F09AEA|nr:cell envelope integrity protein TolA [Luteimonas sp. MC1572]MBJ6981330.1 cell envelope integrity protein TolA [Luteimonas sp. MC1572]QQO02646.1 cell envelope integrity protein TolA [Luteimonas sp. MC1572]
MRESRADTARAFGLALLLHVALFALMFAGLWWTRAAAPQSAAGSPISAEMMDVGDLSPAMQRTLRQPPDPVPREPEPEPPLPEPVEDAAVPPPQPLPEPRPEDSPVTPQPQAQEQVPEPDTVDQEAARRDAISRETAEREQEARRRQEQIDLTERLRQEEAEKQRRLAAQQRERDEKLAELRKQQAQARREAELAEQKLKQIADTRAQQASAQQSDNNPPRGNEGVDPGLDAGYKAAIQAAILGNWTRPENVPLGQECRMTITQVRGGTVVRVEFSSSCPYDELGRRSVEAAVRKAEPLPYAGFESVFNRTLNLNFRAKDR